MHTDPDLPIKLFYFGPNFRYEKPQAGRFRQFYQFGVDLNAVAEDKDARFAEMQKYIRFEDGKILLGEVGNQLQLEIRNNQITFLQNGVDVAYFSDNKLYVKDGLFTNSLRIGNFGVIPRTNGNLSIKLMT